MEHARAYRWENAASAGKVADSLLATLSRAQAPRAPLLVARAGIVSQCLLPGADVKRDAEGISGRAIALLDSALALDPTDWTARFILASISYRTRCFAGRQRLAVEQLDHLLKLGDGTAPGPRFARVFEYRGRLYKRDGMADSAHAVWGRGLSLFPADTVLLRLYTTDPTPSPCKI